MALNVPKRIPDFPQDPTPENSDKFTFWDDALGVMKYVSWQSIKTLLAAIFVPLTRTISVGSGLTVTNGGVLDDDIEIGLDLSTSGETPTEDTEYNLSTGKKYVLRGTNITVNFPEGAVGNLYQEFDVWFDITGEAQLVFQSGQGFSPTSGFNSSNKAFGGNRYKFFWDGNYWYF